MRLICGKKKPLAAEASRRGAGLTPRHTDMGVHFPSWLGGGPGVPTVKYYIILKSLF